MSRTAGATDCTYGGGLSADYAGNRGDNGYGGATPAGILGMDWMQNGWVYGGFLGYGRQRSDFGDQMGRFRSSDTTLGAFAGWYGANAWANLQASYSWQRYDIDRQTRLGPQRARFSGAPDGSDLTLAGNAGYQWHLDGKSQISHGPIAGLIYQKIQRDGYTEKYNELFEPIALGYRDEDAGSLLGKLGWTINAHVLGVEPYAELSYQHEFRDDFGRGKEASARSIAVPVAGYYHVPGLQIKDDYINGVFGLRFNKGDLAADLGVSGMLDRDALQNSAVYLTLGKAF